MILHKQFSWFVDALTKVRAKVAAEIYESEKVYVKRLDALIRLYKKPLQRAIDEKKPIVGPESLPAIFANVEGTYSGFFVFFILWVSLLGYLTQLTSTYLENLFAFWVFNIHIVFMIGAHFADMMPFGLPFLQKFFHFKSAFYMTLKVALINGQKSKSLVISLLIMQVRWSCTRSTSTIMTTRWAQSELCQKKTQNSKLSWRKTSLEKIAILKISIVCWSVLFKDLQDIVCFWENSWKIPQILIKTKEMFLPPLKLSKKLQSTSTLKKWLLKEENVASRSKTCSKTSSTMPPQPALKSTMKEKLN